MSLPNLPHSLPEQLDLLSTQLDEIKPYLLSPELFWPLGSALGGNTRLTLGNMLLNLQGLQARQGELAPAQQTRLQRLEANWDAYQVKWGSAIAKKALRELGARLNLWRGYLTDLAEGLGNRLHYASEVRNRVLFELLIPLGAPQDEVESLHAAMDSLDRRFRSASTAASFVWDPAYEAGFPAERFEMLYREPLTEPRKSD